MAAFTPDEGVRIGAEFWTLKVDGFPEEQNALACEYEAGHWTVEAINASTGGSRYEDTVAGAKVYDNLTVKYLCNNKTKTVSDLGQDMAKGGDKYKKRVNISLVFLKSDKSEVCRINWLNALAIQYRDSGFGSLASGDAKYEWMTFRCAKGEVA